MNTIKIEKKHAQMIAHRGLSGLEPENSIPAFIAAGNRSYYGVETDVHVTKDGKFVVIHDDDTERVAGYYRVIEETLYDDLKDIRLNDLCRLEILSGTEKVDLKDRRELVIPDLKDYINICKKYEKVCILELKNQFAPDDIIRLVKEIKDLEYLEQVTFISFQLPNLIELRKLMPEQPLQYLVEEFDNEVFENLVKYQLELDIRHTELTEEIITMVHNAGRIVNCWTCDSKETAERLVSWGVDFITSNYLE
ncbi:MAG: hypothetical protein IKU20_00815 [Lachnospiraceae bacterium]|nr:hypothetical protein [Lachnospiraceae bacterium]